MSKCNTPWRRQREEQRWGVPFPSAFMWILTCNSILRNIFYVTNVSSVLWESGDTPALSTREQTWIVNVNCHFFVPLEIALFQNRDSYIPRKYSLLSLWDDALEYSLKLSPSHWYRWFRGDKQLVGKTPCGFDCFSRQDLTDVALAVLGLAV